MAKAGRRCATIATEMLCNAQLRGEGQRIGVEPHSFARERHGAERRGQALNGNGVVLQSVAMALCCSVKFGKGFDCCV